MSFPKKFGPPYNNTLISLDSFIMILPTAAGCPTTADPQRISSEYQNQEDITVEDTTGVTQIPMNKGVETSKHPLGDVNNERRNLIVCLVVAANLVSVR